MWLACWVKNGKKGTNRKGKAHPSASPRAVSHLPMKKEKKQKDLRDWLNRSLHEEEDCPAVGVDRAQTAQRPGPAFTGHPCQQSVLFWCSVCQTQ